MSSGIVTNFAPSLPLGVLLRIGDGLLLETITKFASHVTRENWREGSSIIKILKQDHWWNDYRTRPCARAATTTTWTWIDWCKDKMIIGPPRSRSYREEAELDEDYLTMEDIFRHCRPWSKTWPHSDDHSWCTGPHHTTLPEWVIAEYNDTPNPSLC